MIRLASASMLLVLAVGCVAEEEEGVDLLEDVDGTAGGKEDGAAWSRKVVAPNAQVWNGGPQEYGAGTSIALRADGTPVIAYYSAEYFCNNGGWGTYSSDGMVLARLVNGTWTRTVEACGPTAGYWPRVRVDAMDRTHVVFGSGWYTGQQRAVYFRKNAAWVREEWNPWIASDYMSDQPLALTLDSAGVPTLFVDGKLINIGPASAGGSMNVKTNIFANDGMSEYFERDGAGNFHFVAWTMIPDSPTMSTARMRYASRVGTTVTVEVPRTELKAQPLGMVIDSANRPHILSTNLGATPGHRELWESTKTAAGWVDTLIANDAFENQAAMTMTASGELIVVTSGRLYRRAPNATTWTSSLAPLISGARHLSAIVGADNTLHVAFQNVGATRNNRSAPAPVYYASVKL